jgi:hypothetical protein
MVVMAIDISALPDDIESLKAALAASVDFT